MIGNRYGYLLILKIVACIFSCTASSDMVNEFNSIEVTRKWSIPLDSLTISRNFYYYSVNGREYIYQLNRILMAIQVYSLNEENLLKKIYLEREGPNGVGNPTSIHVINQDSILVFASKEFRLSLINKDAEKLNSYILLNSKEFKDNKLRDFKNIYTGEVNDVLPTSNADVLLIKDKLYVKTYPFKNPILSPQKFYDNAFSNMIIDLNTGEISHNMPFPDSYKGKVYPVQFSIEYYRVYNPNRNTFIYSFSADKYLYEYTLDGKLLAKHLADSDKFLEIPSINRKSGYDSGEDYQFFLEKTRFGKVFYNLNKDLYYRYIHYPVYKANKKQPIIKQSIIILDNK